MKGVQRFILSMTAFLLLIGPLPVLAHETEPSTDPGTTPDSPLWGIDVALDKIGILLATTDDAKAHANLHIAAERLAEVKAMIAANKVDDAAKAENEHTHTLAEVKARIKALKEAREEDELDDTAEIESEVEKHESDVEEVNSAISVKLKVRGTLTGEQRARLDAFLDSLTNSTADVRIEIRQKKDALRAKFEARGLDDDEINEKFNETEGRHGLHEFLQAKASERIEMARTAIADAKTAAEVLSAEIGGGNATNASVRRLNAGLHLIERAEFHLNVSETALTENQTGKAFGQATAALHIARNAERVLTGRLGEDKGVGEADDEEERHEKVEIKINSEGNQTRVGVRIERDGTRERVEFTLNTTDCATIKQEIDARTSLTAEEVETFLGTDCETQEGVRARFKAKFETERAELEHKLRVNREEFLTKLRARARGDFGDMKENETEEDEMEDEEDDMEENETEDDETDEDEDNERNETNSTG
ncbi:MAG: hypothetical protein HYS81_02015 [Candidatus Aenigmatarchaeota archaeon]|nr:MAG: hypothetical protein HYS81_02015 [Candidatus Aenigmarchaeota archaeon]